MTAARQRCTNRSDDLDLLVELLWEIRNALFRAKIQVDREIRNYPTPITRCDAQFNHLHDQQRRLARELDLIGDDEVSPRGRGSYLEAIERFIASAPCTDHPAERELRSSVKARLPALAEGGRE